MQDHSTVLDQTTWGIHLNFEGHFTSPPNSPLWLSQLQQQDWQRRGIVLWNADLRIVSHLYASYAHELLEHLHNDKLWETEGMVIGLPAFQLSSSSTNTPSTKFGGDWVPKNQIELSADQTQALNKIYQLIAAYGRKVRERKGARQLIENREPKVIPTSIPHGSYFTVYQAAQTCNATSKKIRAWIRKGKIETLKLPGLGIIIEAGKLNEFLYQLRFIQDSPTPERFHEP